MSDELKSTFQKTKELSSKYSKTILFAIIIISGAVLTGMGIIEPQMWIDLVKSLFSDPGTQT